MKKKFKFNWLTATFGTVVTGLTIYMFYTMSLLHIANMTVRGVFGLVMAGGLALFLVYDILKDFWVDVESR